MSTAPRNSVISRQFFRRVAELRTREIQCSAGPNGVSQKVSFYGARATPWVGEIRKVSPTQNGGIRQRDQARQSRPFRRNDEMLSVMPAGLIVFLGNGITGNLADKARRLGIPVWQASGDGA